MADLTVSLDGTPVAVYLGDNVSIASARAAAAGASAEDAALSAATAESAAGPTYADTTTGLAATASGEAFAVDNGDGTVTVYLNSAGSAVAQRTLATTAALASTGGAAMVVTADGRTVQARIDELTVGALRIPPSGDATGVTDTRNFREAIAAQVPVQLADSGAGSYYLLGDVTKDFVGADFNFSVIGFLGAGPESLPRIIVKKPGVTPFPGATLSLLTGVSIEYEQTGFVPAVGADTWPYANAIATTGTISTVGGKLQLEVAGGLIGADAEFPDVTRGSMVVLLDNPANTQDYWVNNYADHDSIFQIDEVISDTVCTLQGKDGTAYTGPIHIRGNAAASIWTTYQPTQFYFTDNWLRAIPGCGLMTMGAQRLMADRNLVLSEGQPHIGVIYAGNGQGLNADNGQGGGWGNGGTYHQCSCASNMAFFGCGGFAINGWVDSRIEGNQIDNNASVNAALATYFPNPVAAQSFANLVSTNPTNCSAEDTNSPNGFMMSACSRSRLINPHTFDLDFDTWPVTFEACELSGIEYERLDAGTIGDPAKTVRYVGHGTSATNEVDRRSGGRHGSGVDAYKGGAFGEYASHLDERDVRIVKLVVTEAELESHAASSYIATFDFAEIGLDWEGFPMVFLEWVLFEHQGGWVGSFGGAPPDVSIGTAADDNLVANQLPLNVAAGFYMDAANIGRAFPIGFASGALGTGTLRALFRSGDGGDMNNGTFQAKTITFYAALRGVRA